ncbi:transposase [Anaerolineales bacterium HSG6]|nr:transposase [Anaerolineales bacterium HSG6]
MSNRLVIDAKFEWHETPYKIIQTLPENDEVRLEDMKTGAIKIVPRLTLLESHTRDQLRFIVPKEVANEQTPTQYRHLDLSDCSETQQKVAHYRYAVIEPLLSAPTIKNIKARVAELKSQQSNGSKSLADSASVSSVWRWLKLYKRCGDNIRALIPLTTNRGGVNQTRLAPAVETIIERVIDDIYLKRERCTIKDVRDEVAVRIEEENKRLPPTDQLSLPSLKSIARRIQAVDLGRRLRGKQGKRAANKALTQYGTMTPPTVPLQRVEIDHTLLDLIVVDAEDGLALGRPTLTICLDIATRYPLGYYVGFEPPGYYAVLECLYHAILYKHDTKEWFETQNEWLAYGIPEILVVDNGREFIGHDLDDACLQLGTNLQRTPPRMPHLKGMVERNFRRLAEQLVHTIQGTTFGNIFQRKDYPSEELACITLADFEQMLNIYLVDNYAQDFHQGLKDIPAQRWQECVKNGFAPRIPANQTELEVLLGRVAERTVQHYGIEFKNIKYNAPELAGLRFKLKKEKTKIKYHPGDLSRIHVHDPYENRYIMALAADQEYTQNLSLWKHEVICRAAREIENSVDRVALGRAKRRIQAIVDEEKIVNKKNRKKIARWTYGGKSSHTDEPTVQTEVDTPKIEVLEAEKLLPDVTPNNLPADFFDLDAPDDGECYIVDE